MKIGLIIFAVFSALILVLLLVPVRIKLNCVYDGAGGKTAVVLEYLWFKHNLFGDKKKPKKEKKPKEKKEKEKFSFEKHKAKLEEYINIFESIKADLGKALEYLTKRATVFENISVDVEFGFENAMHTGIFTGLVNGFVYSVLGFIHHKAVLEDMDVNIRPMFEKPCFKASCGCILRSKFVHIIVIAVCVLKILRKIRKTERSS